MAAQGESVQRWLDAADHARAQARRASDHAAHAPTTWLAARFEDEAFVHLNSAECFDHAAVSAFELDEIRLRVEHLLPRSTA